MECIITPISLILGTFTFGILIAVVITVIRKGRSGELPPSQADPDYPFSHFRHLEPEHQEQ